MTENPVTIKGTREGLLVTLGEDDWDAILAGLEEHLAQVATFFAGGRVMLEVGERALETEELETIAALLDGQGVTLAAVLSETTTTRRAARRLGYDITRPQPPAPRRSTETIDGLVVRRTLRSGQSVRHPGTVIVIGDVNPGAEIVAGGDIIVWGHLRGVVHAGALGDNRALVCALSLVPTQLRIGNQIARPPEDGADTPQPEMARVEDDQILVESWNR